MVSVSNPSPPIAFAPRPSRAADIKRLFLFPSYSCSNNCRTCFLHDAERKARYSLDELKFLIGQASDYNFVSIGGGEPSLYPDIVSLVEHCRSRSQADIHMFSNGARLDRDLCASLSLAGLSAVTLTLHSDTDREHDMLTARVGSMRRLLRAVEACLSVGFRAVTAQILIHTWNFRKLLPIAQFAVSLGIRRFSIQNLIPPARCPTAAVPFSQSRPFIEECVAWLDSNKLSWYSNSIPYCILPDCRPGSLIPLLDNTETTNLDYDQVKRERLRNKPYGLVLPPCAQDCPERGLCSGSWKQFWHLFPCESRMEVLKKWKTAKPPLSVLKKPMPVPKKQHSDDS